MLENIYGTVSSYLTSNLSTKVLYCYWMWNCQYWSQLVRAGVPSFIISFSAFSMNSVFISGLKLALLCSWLEPSHYQQLLGRGLMSPFLYQITIKQWITNKNGLSKETRSECPIDAKHWFFMFSCYICFRNCKDRSRAKFRLRCNQRLGQLGQSRYHFSRLEM